MENPEPLRIPDDNEENERKLIEYICSGESLLMVGAGCSKIVGYPLWGELIKLMEEELETHLEDTGKTFSFRKIEEEEDDLSYSTRLIEALEPSRYHAFMTRTFGPKYHSPSHIHLLDLPFRGILTTNYDPTLETALAEVNIKNNINDHDPRIILDEGTSPAMILEFIKCLNHGSKGKRKIAYLHGYYKNGNSLVLGGKDYQKKYARPLPDNPQWPLNKRLLWALMSTRRLVYVGFSMTDPYFQFIHEIASDDFGMYHQDIHFLISSFNVDDQEAAAKNIKAAEKLKRRFGIQTIFYPENDKYTEFPKYIEKLYHQVNTLLGKTSSVDKKDSDEPASSNPVNPVIKPPSVDTDPDQDEFYSATKSGSGFDREEEDVSEDWEENTRSIKTVRLSEKETREFIKRLRSKSKKNQNHED